MTSSPRRRHAIAVAAASIIALLLTGCATPAPVAQTPAPETPTTTPTPTPTETEPVVAQVLFDGDCAQVLPSEAIAEVIGAAGDPREGRDLGTATLGGLGCGWTSEEGSLDVIAYPSEIVPADIAARYETPVCEGFLYDGYGCRVGVREADAWALVTVSPPLGAPADEEPPASLDVAAAHVAEALAGTTGNASTPTAEWWTTSCDDVEAALDLTTLLGVDEYEFGFPADGGEDVDTEINRASGSLIGTCHWYGYAGDDARAVQLWAYPGAATQLESFIEGRDVAPVSIEGAEEALTFPGDGYLDLAISDGVNVVFVDAHDVAVDVDVVGNAVLAALAG
ncbi:hypothetical protein [Microbacterium sp. bgisy189]|uniref:hypothetical protein n=1 Tax=Microbacterium sp. bgisy189 TaxID=3413798 RepID=UPI003EBEEB45